MKLEKPVASTSRRRHLVDRKPKFGIRDLLWVTAALPIGYYAGEAIFWGGPVVADDLTGGGWRPVDLILTVFPRGSDEFLVAILLAGCLPTIWLIRLKRTSSQEKIGTGNFFSRHREHSRLFWLFAARLYRCRAWLLSLIHI